MSQVSYHRCDQCPAQSEDAEGWIHLSAMGPKAHRWRVDAILDAASGTTRGVDLCSRRCLLDYATLQLLDPEPHIGDAP